MKAIGLEGISHLLRNLYLVSRIKNERPLGVLIVAPPGLGKSFILGITRYSKLIFVSDMTPGGLEQILLECRRMGNTGYIVSPELEKILSRKWAIAQYFTLANIILEEGITYLARYNIKVKFEEPLNFGLISALTPETFKRRQEEMEGRGFLSRHLVVGFDYCDADKIAIEGFILRSETPDKIMVRDVQPQEVIIPPQLLPALARLSSRLASVRNDKYRFRAITQLRTLLKAEALANGRTEVEMKDAQSLYCLLPFFLSGNILTQTLFGLERQATDADYCFLRQFIFGEKWFGDGQMNDEETKKWASNRLLKMKLLMWEDGKFKLSKGI